jgi:hypothetical protein
MNSTTKLLRTRVTGFMTLFLFVLVILVHPAASAPLPPALRVTITWDTASNVRFWLTDSLGRSTRNLPYYDPCNEWWCDTPIPYGHYDVYDYDGFGPSTYTLATAQWDAEYRVFLWHPEDQEAPEHINVHVRVEVNGAVVVNTNLYLVDNDGQAEIGAFVPLSTISGQVADNNQNPITGVTITDDGGQVTTTDSLLHDTHQF